MVVKISVFFMSFQGLTVKFEVIVIFAGFVAGHILYLLSVIQIQCSLQTLTKYFIFFREILAHYIKYPEVFSKYLLFAIFEEIVWRYAVQSYLLHLLENPLVAVILTAILFTLDHYSSFLHRNTGCVAEFLIFSIILGITFYASGDFLLVIFIHLVRNCNIVFYRQLFGES